MSAAVDDPEIPEGFIEVPKVYSPERYEYWSDGWRVAWAEPSHQQSTERWSVYLAPEVWEAYKLPRAGWPLRLLETDMDSAEGWVLGMGALIKSSLPLPTKGIDPA